MWNIFVFAILCLNNAAVSLIFVLECRRKRMLDANRSSRHWGCKASLDHDPTATMFDCWLVIWLNFSQNTSHDCTENVFGQMCDDPTFLVNSDFLLWTLQWMPFMRWIFHIVETLTLTEAR